MQEEGEGETKKALASEAAVMKKIAEITLELPNHCLKESYKMGAYTS